MTLVLQPIDSIAIVTTSQNHWQVKNISLVLTELISFGESNNHISYHPRKEGDITFIYPLGTFKYNIPKALARGILLFLCLHFDTIPHGIAVMSQI